MSAEHIIKKCGRMISLKVDIKILDFLDEYAATYGCSRSESIKSIIRGYMASQADKT